MFDGIFWDNDGVLMETEHLSYQGGQSAASVVSAGGYGPDGFPCWRRKSQTRGGRIAR
jgi:hypothetical protein